MPQASSVPQSNQSDHALQLSRCVVNFAGEAMFTVAPNGRFLDVNTTACERLEYSREELLEMSVGEIDPHYPTELWPQHFEDLRRNGKMTFETQHRTKHGRTIDVEVTVTHFEFESQEYCCSAVRDITQRKRAEQILQLQHDVLARVASAAGKLSETLNELCRLVEQMVPDAIVTIMLIDGDDGQLHFEAGPALTDEIREAFEPLQPGPCAGSCGSAAYFKKAIIVEDTRSSDHWAPLRHIIDRFNLLACWSLPIFDDRDQVLGTFAISHQRVTKPSNFHLQILETASHLASIVIGRQRFEEQLRIAHERLAHISRVNTMGEMASSLAHELNQPLAAIVNYAYVLEQGCGGEMDMATIRRHVTKVREQAIRAGEIVTSVRNMARRSSPSRSRVCLNTLVNKSLVMLGPELRRQGISLDQRLDDPMPEIAVDEVQIQQIVVNLVRNAIEAMSVLQRKDRFLSISTEIDSSSLIILRVHDSGPGLTQDQLESIFEPFRTTKPDGMGMGLTICRSIAESHSGQLIAEEDHLRGAAFRLELPMECDD